MLLTVSHFISNIYHGSLEDIKIKVQRLLIRVVELYMEYISWQFRNYKNQSSKAIDKTRQKSTHAQKKILYPLSEHKCKYLYGNI